MKLIVGLGNPGKEYENTRHNIGFMTIDEYFKQKNIIPNWQNKFKAEYSTITLNGEKIYFLKPLTYMNLSGQAVQEIMHYFKITASEILVVHDDLDLPIGRYRIKISSSAGGHNGIKSIIESIGTQDFARLKVGISKDKNYDTKDYVLGNFNSTELKTLKELYPTFIKIIDEFLTTDINRLMNKYNGVK